MHSVGGRQVIIVGGTAMIHNFSNTRMYDLPRRDANGVVDTTFVVRCPGVQRVDI